MCKYISQFKEKKILLFIYYFLSNLMKHQEVFSLNLVMNEKKIL